MGLLKTERLKRQDLNFSYKIYVNKEGEFSTTLPTDIVALFSKAGIALDRNRARNQGYLFADTYEGLKKKVLELIHEYHSKETIEDKIVVQYIIQTTCSYCLDIDGNIVPNRSPLWTKTNDSRWKGGTIDQHAMEPKPYGFQVYARGCQKEVNKYKSGTIKTEYHYLGINDIEEGTYLHWLNSFAAMTAPRGEKLKEIDYTEENAKFFVDLITSICQLNEKIKDFVTPDKILSIINSKQKLLR